MRYIIYEMNNGLWILEWEDGSKTWYPDKESAELMAIKNDKYYSDKK